MWGIKRCSIMSDFHPGVVVLLISGLIIFWLTPISAWWMLSGQGDRNARIWFLGTAVYAVAATLFIFGGELPEWLSKPLVNGLALVSVMCMTEALRRELSDAPPPYKLYALIVGLHAGVLFVCYAFGIYGGIGFAMHLVMISLVELFMIGLTNRVRHFYRSKSLWLVMLILAAFMISNLSRVVEFWIVGRFSMLLDFTFLASAGLVVNYLSVVFYCYGYWGFVVEKNEAQLAQETERTLLAQRGEVLAVQREQLAEEMLRQRTEMLERLATVGKLAQYGALSASIAHEINQPLAAVQLNIEEAKRLSDEFKSPQVMRTLLDRVEQNNMRAAQIVRRVRNMFSQRSLQLELLALDDVVRSVTVLLERRLAQDQVALDLALNAARPFRLAAGEVEHLLLNLMDNALDALRQSPVGHRRVYIETWLEDNCACLSVADSGPGIAQHLRGSLFELRETTKTEGMGLGLWLARHIADRHGGELTLDENHVPGARFVMRLPYAV